MEGDEDTTEREKNDENNRTQHAGLLGSS